MRNRGLAMKEELEEQHCDTTAPACQSQVKPSLKQGERCFSKCCGTTAGASMKWAFLEKGGRQEEGRTG